MRKFYSTECVCGRSIGWNDDEEIPICPDCGRKGHFRHPPLIYHKAPPITINGGNLVTAPPLIEKPLREWWHEVVRRYDHYPSYAMLLALPADEEVICYQKEFGKELHLITGEHCLVITLTGLGFMRYGSDDDEVMPLAVEESTSNGYCLKIADLFNIQFSQFPCLILFRDIRSPDHILISLKGLSKEEVAEEMRELFSVIKQAVKEGKDPLKAVESYSKRQEFTDKTKATWSGIQTFVGKTLEKVMQVLIEANLK